MPSLPEAPLGSEKQLGSIMPSGQMWEPRVLRRQQAHTCGNGINAPPLLVPPSTPKLSYQHQTGWESPEVWVGTSQEQQWEMEQNAHFPVPAFPPVGSDFRDELREDGLSLRDLDFLPCHLGGESLAFFFF